MHACRRADVDDIISRHDRVFVMLDDDHGIADIAQVFQRFQQPGIVALVEADRGLVEHVEHAGEGPSRSARQAGCAGFRRPDSVPELRDRLR